MYKSRRRGIGANLNNRKAEINMIPFLDVLLTLLLIFMVATPVVNPTLNVDVPQSSQARVNPLQSTKDIIVVEVHRDNTYTIILNANNNTNTYAGLDDNSFIARMNAILLDYKNKPADQGINNILIQLAADQTVEYGRVVEALTQLKKFGFTDIGLLTKPVSSELPFGTNVPAAGSSSSPASK